MGEVYRARDTRLQREIAIKILPANLSRDPSSRQRLEREAKAVSKLNHPHICTLHDLGAQDGMDLLVMELLEGETVEHRLSKGPLPVEQTVRVAAQIADALKNRCQADGFWCGERFGFGSPGGCLERDDGGAGKVDGRGHDCRHISVHGAGAEWIAEGGAPATLTAAKHNPWRERALWIVASDS